MKKSRWSLLLVLGGLLAPAALVAQEAVKAVADSKQLAALAAIGEEEQPSEDLGYGFALADGQVAIAADTAFVLSPAAGTLVLRWEEMERAKETLKAEATSETEWTVVTPDEERVTVQLLFAAYEYDAAEIKAPSEGSALPVITADRVARLPLSALAFRFRWRHACGTPANCGDGPCYGWVNYSTTTHHLVCRYTGKFWDLCLERLKPVCALNYWRCYGCYGGILFQVPINKWVCATY
jgi:hypothetical protein